MPTSRIQLASRGSASRSTTRGRRFASFPEEHQRLIQCHLDLLPFDVVEHAGLAELGEEGKGVVVEGPPPPALNRVEFGQGALQGRFGNDLQASLVRYEAGGRRAASKEAFEDLRDIGPGERVEEHGAMRRPISLPRRVLADEALRPVCADGDALRSFTQSKRDVGVTTPPWL